MRGVLNWQGEIISVIGEPQTVANPDLVKAQLAAIEREKGLEFSIELIQEKITASQETLKTLPNEYGWSETVHRLEFIKKSLKHRATDFNQLRMVEALAAQLYFAVWRKIPLKWKEDRKRPIPGDWRFFTQRESMIGAQNRHATHPVNAMLNYAYRVLETQVKIETVAAGLDRKLSAKVRHFLEQSCTFAESLRLSEYANPPHEPSIESHFDTSTRC